MTLRDEWLQSQLEADSHYAKQLASFDPQHQGISIVCPSCSNPSWVMLPLERRDNIPPIKIACPHGCGHFEEVEAFNLDSAPIDPIEYDVEVVCPRDQTRYRTFGKFHRCPFCAYENSREIMREASAHVERSIARGFESRDDLSDMLARIVSVFDGVMRICSSEAVRMYQQGSPYEANPVRSFQSLEAARNKMMPHWDMAAAANDWTTFKLAFQKRHCFAHTLGVIDQSYIDKSGDNSAILGRNVRLSPEEVRECARNAVRIVDRFFGQYFS